MYKKGIFFGVLSVFLITGIILLVKYFNKENKKNDTQKTFIDNGTDFLNNEKILHLGDKGLTVKKLQETINSYIDKWSLSINPVIENGLFDDFTESAIKQISYNYYSSFKNNVSINNINSL